MTALRDLNWERLQQRPEGFCEECDWRAPFSLYGPTDAARKHTQATGHTTRVEIVRVHRYIDPAGGAA